ncbi:MAG: NAD-dependent epimerase/dehydratase family protein [Gemmatimonadota bacterium]
MKIFIAGGTGAIGRRLVPLLVGAGHEVTALVRSEGRAGAARDLGAEPAVADALDADVLRRAVLESAPDAVINQLTSIPDRIDPRRVVESLAATNRLRREATGTLVRAALEAGSRRFLTQTIAFIYRPDHGDPAGEDEPLYVDAPSSFSPIVDAALESEELVLEAHGLEGIVLRYGHLYGPGTAYSAEGTFTDDVRRRRVPIIGDGAGVWSFVHVDDAATATVAALEQGGAGVYNVVDDDPAPLATWLPEYARILGARPPRRVPRLLGRLGAGAFGVFFMTRQRGVSNAKAKRELAWRPTHASWREGFESELSRT